ncbi:MAG TPA: hypothetical protein VGQ59_15860 [Cyclobacteriaceae bacterium]|jgi:hypothetical protein|nr:hypothetical protein [Cyclobacteriaceae bacterium]
MDENKTKIVAPYGVNDDGLGKALVFDGDLSNKNDADFASDLEAVAATKPRSLQDFIMRLVEVQKMPKPLNPKNEGN